MPKGRYHRISEGSGRLGLALKMVAGSATQGHTPVGLIPSAILVCNDLQNYR
jgi:hypothetical protein